MTYEIFGIKVDNSLNLKDDYEEIFIKILCGTYTNSHKLRG